MAKRVRSVDMSTVGERNTVFVSVEVRDAASRASLRAKLTAAGIHNEVAKAARGRCVWLIGCKAKVVKTKEVAVVAG